jgi:hypothetical protein
MKTIMNKLITIKSIPVLALALLLVLGTVLSDGAAAQDEKTTPPLTCSTEYFFEGDEPPYDLAWVGPVSGDIEGVIKWYLLSKSPHPAPPSQVGQMLFRWEIWDEDEEVLLLAGEERERTIVRHGKNSVWRANGIVTEASEDFEDYIGSQTHDGGNFTWDPDTGLPDHGFGTLRIAGSAAGSK